jgi:endonuclease/exonuclease/phosphatase family metal-dependent hydrolase
MMDHRFRIVTYNVHKCRGMDRRVRPERIARILREIRADIVALQEVLSVEGGRSDENQARFIADELGFDYRFGENRKLRGGAYGNIILSRLPIIDAQNYDLSVKGREQRGCLRVDLRLGSDKVLHIYNVHLGTAYRERPHQTRRLLNGEILDRNDLNGSRVLLGDFNEWVQGITSRLLANHFASADIRSHLGTRRTYPGFLPFLHLDHIYFDSTLKLESAYLHRSRMAVIASDHLPIIADLRIAESAESAA